MMDTTAAPVVFVCQRCKLPLRLDGSLLELDAARYHALAGPAPPAPAPALVPAPAPALVPAPTGEVPVYRVVNRGQEELVEPPATLVDAGSDTRDVGDSFVLVGPLPLTEAAKARPVHRTKVAAKLFDALTTQSRVDHPVCEDCVVQVQADVREWIKDTDSERAAYEAFLASDARTAPDPATLSRTEDEIAQMRVEEQQLLGELDRLASEQERLQATVADLEREAADVRALEEQYWRDLNAFQAEQATFRNERDALVRRHTNTSEQLARLRSTHVLMEIFRIGKDGDFGTINGCRLGRLPNQQVEWAEINAAWGQALLLLHTLARRVRFEFETYKLTPVGSFSRIERVVEPLTSYELFGSGEYRTIFRSSQKLDGAMMAFVDCMAQLAAHMRKADRHFKLRRPIEGERVGGFSVKYNVDMNWTRALRYVLDDLQDLMVAVSAHTASWAPLAAAT